MKKVFALLLTAALAAAATTTAFADAQNSQTIGPENTTRPDMSVTYTVDPAYTVTIPASVTLGNTAIVSASDVKIGKNQTLKVTLSGTSEDDNTFKVKAGDETLTYTVTKGNTNITVGSEVLSVNTETSGDALKAELSFSKPNATYAGTYQGTVTFTVSMG